MCSEGLPRKLHEDRKTAALPYVGPAFKKGALDAIDLRVYGNRYTQEKWVIVCQLGCEK